jgi:hypothetical protein
MNTKNRAPFVAVRQALSRRRFLQGAGVAMSLPFLDAMLPRTARAATPSLAPGATPRRIFGICNNLGLRPDLFFPTGAGREYVASPYLKLLEAHRDAFTVVSGVSHPNVDGGHPSDISFLTAAPHPASSSFDTGRSILDAVADQAKTLERDVGARDRTRLEQYFTSVRDLEHRLQESREWERKPKPVVKAAPPADLAGPAQYMDKVKAMYDLVRLAFETDSTRAITLMLNSVATPVVTLPGETITDSYHNLSHHGKADEKLAQLKVLDEWHMKLLNDLFAALKSVREGGESLLDRTMILYGSNLGDANAHSTTNLPTLFAGGGFRHGQHLAFDTAQNYPLPNLFVSVLQRMGLEEDKFSSSTGTMRGLEMT